jgi:hypothetical protein
MTIILRGYSYTAVKRGSAGSGVHLSYWLTFFLDSDWLLVDLFYLFDCQQQLFPHMCTL